MTDDTMTNWPSREEWARRERTFNGDVQVSECLVDYATGEEIEAARKAVRRALRRDGGRWRLREALGSMREGLVPIHRDRMTDIPEIALINERYDAALAAETARIRAIVESRPVDDAAWAAELQRRSWVDRLLSDPTSAATSRERSEQ